MDLRIIFFIVLICTSCASVKELRVSNLEEIDYLLNTPTAIAQYNVEYRNYGNRAEFEWDTLVVNVEEYNYQKLDSLFLELTLNPDSWKVSELLKVYETFEGRFFDRYNSFVEIKKWTLGANVDHSHILDDAIALIRNMDYLIYAKNRYGRKGFNKSYDIFKRECALREEFRKRENYEDWREATRDMDEVDYFTSKKYRYHVIQGNIWPYCGRYTMLDEYVFGKTDFFLKEITTFRNKVINKDKDIVHDPEYSYVNELRQSLFGRWFYLLDTNFDTFLLSELNVDKGFDSNNYLSRHVMKRGDEGSVMELYDFWTRNALSSFNLTQVGANFSLLDLSSSTSIGVIRKSLYADLVNYCSLDSVAKNSVGLMSELDWKDPQIDSLLNVRNANPCERK